MAHVRYNKILTHSYSTPGLSCHFSVFGLFFLFFSSFFLGGGGRGEGAQSLLGIARQWSREKFSISTLLVNLGIMLILLYIVDKKFC